VAIFVCGQQSCKNSARKLLYRSHGLRDGNIHFKVLRVGTLLNNHVDISMYQEM
jgi:hypothetical protein